VRRGIPTAIAVTVGLTTLVGYLFAPLVPGLAVHLLFIRWAAILAAVAFLLGILNLFSVHVGRVAEMRREWPYSLILILAASLVIIIALLEQQGPGGRAMTWLFQYTLFPLEASAASLLLFFMVTTAYRAMSRRPTGYTFLFLLTIVLVLLGAIPFSASLADPLSQVRHWVVNVFATAGARGMLLGVALGTITAGLRVLLGIDRPHSEREP